MNPILKRIEDRRKGRAYMGDLKDGAISFQASTPTPTGQGTNCIREIQARIRQKYEQFDTELFEWHGCESNFTTGLLELMVVALEGMLAGIISVVSALPAGAATPDLVAKLIASFCALAEKALGWHRKDLEDILDGVLHDHNSGNPRHCTDVENDLIRAHEQAQNAVQYDVLYRDVINTLNELSAVTQQGGASQALRPDLLAPLIASALISAAYVAARTLGTILGGMAGGGPAGAVAAGLILLIQSILQGMNLEAFRGKSPDEMAKMLPNYDQLVQATQIALEKGTDVQTELASLGATS